MHSAGTGSSRDSIFTQYFRNKNIAKLLRPYFRVAKVLQNIASRQYCTGLQYCWNIAAYCNY
jgi:hypothetical protein